MEAFLIRVSTHLRESKLLKKKGSNVVFQKFGVELFTASVANQTLLVLFFVLFCK